MKEKNNSGLTIVGIGASAGGLHAIEKLFENTAESEMISYVIIQHLSSKYESMLKSILEKHTNIDIQEIKEGVTVQGNRIYLKPTDKDVIIKNHRFYLPVPTQKRGSNLPIDRFFSSLAKDLKEKAIGVILSGTGTDGTLGLKEIKGEGGIVISQDIEQAEYKGMPESALRTKMVDFSLPVEEIGSKIRAYVMNPSLLRKHQLDEVKQQLWKVKREKILTIIHEKTDHDFSHYKKNTLDRRIKRRMDLHQIDDIDTYIKFLQENETEIEHLFKDLTIKVTSFFRDPEAFENLKEEAIIPLINKKTSDSTLRIWVPGCDSGEEAYSLAIICKESLEQLDKTVSIQIFATDIDADSIEAARNATYPLNIVSQVDDNRLDRYFTKSETAYKIKKEIREMIVFAEHNLIKDPPFSKIDLISCRNLLIYLDKTLQSRLLPMFHYVLQDEGILFVGVSESIGQFTNLFHSINSKHRIFQRKTGVTNQIVPNQNFYPNTAKSRYSSTKEQNIEFDFSQLINQIILDRFSPPSVLINENYEILYFAGDTNKYLANPKGKRSFNILDMARRGLKSKIRDGVKKAQHEQRKVQYENCQLRSNGSYKRLNVIIEPVRTIKGHTLVVFEEVNLFLEGKAESDDSVHDLEKQQLKKDLKSTQADLQMTIEEQQTANEELQSLNEELQSTNEELETSREELQATNEELSTVNAELQQKIEELSEERDYANNLLENSNVATIFLDTKLRITRFTPQAKKIFKLREVDIHRPLNEITSKLTYKNIHKDITQVLDTLEKKEISASDLQGNEYTIRIVPYRTSENQITGVVISMIDVTELTNAKQLAEGIEIGRAHV